MPCLFWEATTTPIPKPEGGVPGKPQTDILTNTDAQQGQAQEGKAGLTRRNQSLLSSVFTEGRTTT